VASQVGKSAGIICQGGGYHGIRDVPHVSGHLWRERRNSGVMCGFLSRMRKLECEENSETMPPLTIGMFDEGEAGLERGWQRVPLGIALNRQQGLTRTGTRTGTGTNNLSF
jgi:hypothetical protein